MKNSHKTTAGLVLAVLLLAASGAGSQTDADTPAPVTAFEWNSSTPEQQGVDSAMLLRSIRRIREESLDVRSLIIIRNDHVILELYVHPYTRDTVHNVKSVSKSILSALVGIALREEVLEGTNQTVREFFPDYFPEEAADSRNKITLLNLLTMTSGLDLDENGPKMQAVFASDDWIRTTFEADMAAEPGERFVYSTPLTHTMVGILTEASGKSVLELATEHLFGPLEFGALQWTRGPKGYYFGGAELFLRTCDMAKFGLLYLHGGDWGGAQVVPAEWVIESTQNRLPDGASDLYGYWWWIDPDGGGFKAHGWGGQGITVRKDLRMVAAGTAGNPTAGDRMFRDFDPAMISDEPLPPNPDAVAAIEAFAHELENPTPGDVPPLPEIASEVSGKTYRMDDNPRNLEEFTFRFEPTSRTATVASMIEGEAFESEIGLDGVYRLNEMGENGPMPQSNMLALRGRWTAEDELTVDSHPVGDPIHSTWTIKFTLEKLHVEVEVHPIGQRFTLTGLAK